MIDNAQELRNFIQHELDGSSLAVLTRQGQRKTYTVATRPATAKAGQIIFVSDAAAGAKFQGWDGSAWVNLG